MDLDYTDHTTAYYCQQRGSYLRRLPAGKHRFVVRQAGNPRPVGFGGSAQDPEYPKQLVDLRVPGEERLAGDHLGEDTAEAPVVHTGAVEFGAEQNLGRAVPERHNLVRLHRE